MYRRSAIINYEAVEERIRAGYREVTAQYRRDDEVEVQTENHRRLAATLKAICRSFPSAISVLDVGCGTGRYFHCLENVRVLTGIDISQEMLDEAGKPVRQKDITAAEIQLLRANIYLASFPPQTFDFIYSLGMFGHGCPVTVEICNKLHDWLKPDGKLFFDIVDFAALPWWYRARRAARKVLYPALPQAIQVALDKREQRSPFFGLTRRQLSTVLNLTRFRNFTIHSQPCHSPLWSGRHLECLATKAGTTASTPVPGKREPAQQPPAAAFKS